MNPYQTPYPNGPPQGMPTAPDNYYGYQGYPNAAPAYNMPYNQGYGSQPMPQGQYPAYNAYPQQYAGYPEQVSGYPQQPSGYPQQPSGYPQQPSGYPQQPSGYPQQSSGYPQQPSGYPVPDNTYGQQSYGYGSYGDQNQTQQGSYDQTNSGYGQHTSAQDSQYKSPGNSGNLPKNPPSDSLANFGRFDDDTENSRGKYQSSSPSAPPPATENRQKTKPERPRQPPMPKPRSRNDGKEGETVAELRETNKEWRGISDGMKSEPPTDFKGDHRALSGISSDNPSDRARYQKNLDALASLMTDVDLDELDKKP